MQSTVTDAYINGITINKYIIIDSKTQDYRYRLVLVSDRNGGAVAQRLVELSGLTAEEATSGERLKWIKIVDESVVIEFVYVAKNGLRIRYVNGSFTREYPPIIGFVTL
ncbi:MAG: hypothetical protein ACOX3W_09705 [Christensenellaceae bacterium]